MDSAKLNEWMRIVGLFAVVASLIFVGLQMKQSQEIALADQYQSRAESAQDMYLSFYEGGSSVDSIVNPTNEATQRDRDGLNTLSLWEWAQ